MSVRMLRAFYARLVATTDGGSSNPVKDAVGSRIHALEAPASSALPLIVFDIASTSTEGFFDGNQRTEATFDVTIFAKTEAGIDSVGVIEEKVFELLHDQNLVATGDLDRAYVRCVSRGVPQIEGEFLRVDSTFLVEGNDSSTI